MLNNIFAHFDRISRSITQGYQLVVDMCMHQKEQTHFNNVIVFRFSTSVVLMSMRTRDKMRDTNFIKNELSFSYSPPKSVCIAIIF
jgi:hypothetical protein